MQKREDIISAIVNLAVPAFTHQEVMEHRQHEVMEKTKKTVLRSAAQAKLDAAAALVVERIVSS